MPKPIVAIVGRPNVGKSTLFNRLIKQKHAIIDATAGVTRDRNYTQTDWAGKNFILVDTGGVVGEKSKDEIELAIREQAFLAIEEANVLLFVVDAISGITNDDLELAQKIKRDFVGNKVILISNKADNQNLELSSTEFYKFGLGEPHPISALNGRRIGDLLDDIIDGFPEDIVDESEGLRIAIVGKPNVGKSSMANLLLGKKQHIVTNIPGTTRDAVDSEFKYFGKSFTLIDTAGLRKKAKVKNAIEFYSTLRTTKAIERSDLVIQLISGNETLDVQDIRVFNEAYSFKKPIILVVNKWDLVDKDKSTLKDYTEYLEKRLPELKYIPKVFTSAITKQRVSKIMELVEPTYAEYQKRIPTAKLNEVMENVFFYNPPSSKNGRFIKIKFVSQIKHSPPVFAFFVNRPNLIEDPYRKYLERKIREEFGFIGSPLILEFKQK
ncbi:MAG: ribosome biogenesis GTPase Der [Calditrichaeota bacterium]|nr:MAG: ribosome biogenesis GTPase Der [Calditrichota bacterium]